MIGLIIIIVILVLIYLMLLAQGKHGIDGLVIIFGAKKRRPKNISHLQKLLPQKLQPTLNSLTNLGFSRLGETQLNLPGDHEVNSWIIVSDDRLTQLELVEVDVRLVIFTTFYENCAVLETSFPYGENIETPNFRSHTITASMEKAYEHHLRQMTDFGRNNGSPRRIENMEDYLHADTIYRERFVEQKFRRNTWVPLAKVLALGYGIIATSLFVGYWLQWDHLTMAKLQAQLLLLLQIIVPAVLFTFIAPLIALWSRRRNAQSA